MTKEPRPDYPTADPRSLAYEVARTTLDAAVSVVPGAGYAVGKVVERFIAAPLQKRRDEWFQCIGEGLQTLEARLDGFDPSQLDQNVDFVSAVFEATQGALKTVNEEKIEALRNGILNIAAGMTISEIVRGTFFSLIDRFSPAHFRVLRLLANPAGSPEMVKQAEQTWAGAQIGVLRAALPEEMLAEDALKRILVDLDREGLASTGSMFAMGTQGSLLAKRSTAIGDSFIKFVSDPIG